MSFRLLALSFVLLGLVMPASGAEFRKLEAALPPVLDAADLQGRAHDLPTYRGQVVLVNFWASWCPPCRKEMPSMQSLMKKLTGKPFVILAVDTGESRDEAQDFLKTMRVDFAVLLDSDSVVAKRWKVFAMPTSFLMDKQGRVRYVLPGGTEWDDGEGLKLIDELLAE